MHWFPNVFLEISAFIFSKKQISQIPKLRVSGLP